MSGFTLRSAHNVQIAGKYNNIFGPEEVNIILINLASMRNDLQVTIQEQLEESHNGFPTVVAEVLPESGPGRPKVHIDPTYLAYAITQRTISGIAEHLQVHRATVRRRLLEYGLIQAPSTMSDDRAEPSADSAVSAGPAVLSTELTDDQLDQLIRMLRSHYPRAGNSMLDGMLRTMGYRITRTRIAASLTRLDPVRRVFQPIRIQRRQYKVAGPNALWHHDGQHGQYNQRALLLRELTQRNQQVLSDGG